MAAVGDAAAVMGLVTLPLFIASAIIGIINMANSMNESKSLHQSHIRFTAIRVALRASLLAPVLLSLKCTFSLPAPGRTDPFRTTGHC